MREMPENIVFRYPRDADEQRQQEIRDEAQHDIEHGISIMEFPSAKNEVEKEPWEKQIIELINQEVKKYFSEEQHINVTGIDSDLVHFYKREDFNRILRRRNKGVDPQLARATAVHNQVLLTNEIRESPYPRLETTKVLIHEALHSSEFKKFSEWDMGPFVIPQKLAMPEREGISISSRKRFPEHSFTGLQEGITELLSQKILHNVVHDNPFYREELDARFAKIDQKIGRDQLFREWGVQAYDIIDGDIEKVEGNTTRFSWARSGTYMDEQNLILFLARQISSAEHDRFPTTEAALKLFFNAQYRGELLNLGREIDHVIGKGTFRMLATIPESHQEGNYIAKNVLKFLSLPLEKRDPEDAKKYIFGNQGDHSEQFEKYLKQANKEK
jgi:hypothetical protein